jgi:hypothetical protein
MLSDLVEHMELNLAVQTKEMRRIYSTTRGRLRNSTPRQLSEPVFSQLRSSSVLVSAVLTCFCDSLASLDGIKD